MFRLTNLAYGKKSGIAVLLLASGISLTAYSADASKDKTQRQCAEIAGGKTADLQAGVMQECMQGKSSEPRASGMEATEHARIKSCDTQAKAMDEPARPRFLRECYAGKK